MSIYHKVSRLSRAGYIRQTSAPTPPAHVSDRAQVVLRGRAVERWNECGKLRVCLAGLVGLSPETICIRAGSKPGP